MASSSSDRPASTGDPGPGTLAAALAASRAVDRARIELVTTVAGPGAPVAVVNRGAYDRAAGRAQAESDMSALAAALEAAGQPLGGDWSHPTRVVIDGETLYSQLGPMAEALGRSATDWSRAQLLAVMAHGATDNDALALALDPLGPLDLLERPVVEIGEVGRDEIRGESAVHLRASLALAGPTADGATEPSAASFEGRLRAVGVEVLPVDVWLDGAGVVRRLHVSFDAALAGRAPATGMSTTFDLHDVDGDVTVEVPPDSAVVTPGA